MKLCVCIPAVPQLPRMKVASFLRNIMLSCVACNDQPYFSKISHKRLGFRTKSTKVFKYALLLTHFIKI
jgi:hypothetical protein